MLGLTSGYISNKKHPLTKEKACLPRRGAIKKTKERSHKENNFEK
jgi:hypothetical protein